MLTHVVLFDPQPVFEPAEEERFMREMQGFTELPGVLESRAGRVVRGQSDQYSHAAVMRFEDMAGLTDLYIPHPRHLAFAPWIRGRTRMAVFDFHEGQA